MLLTLTIVLFVLGAIGFGVAWRHTDYNTGRGPQWAEAVGVTGIAALVHAGLGAVIGGIGTFAGVPAAGYVLGALGGLVALGYGVYLELFGDEGETPWITAGAALLVIGILAWLLV